MKQSTHSFIIKVLDE